MSENSKFGNIDMMATGRHIRSLIMKAGYSVGDIQRILGLSCPQPVYRWFQGRVLPSIDHLYKLSMLLEVHMENMLVTAPPEFALFLWQFDAQKTARRFEAYSERMVA